MLILAEILLWAVPFSRLARWLGAPGEGPKTTADASGIATALTRAGRALPWHPSCLRLALAGAVMLRRRRMPWVVHFGVSRDESGIISHAWLKVGDSFVSGAAEHSRFTPIAAFHGLER